MGCTCHCIFVQSHRIYDINSGCKTLHLGNKDGTTETGVHTWHAKAQDQFLAPHGAEHTGMALLAACIAGSEQPQAEQFWEWL